MQKVIYYSAALIGTYLLVANATGAGRILKEAGAAGSGYVKTLQGR